MADSAHDFAKVLTSGWEDLHHKSNCWIEDKVVVELEETSGSDVANEDSEKDATCCYCTEGEYAALVLEGASIEECYDACAEKLEHCENPELVFADGSHRDYFHGGLASGYVEAVEDEPAEPSADDFGDDVHDTADDRHTARGHHANCNDWVKAGARECVDCDVNCDERNDEPASVSDAPG